MSYSRSLGTRSLGSTVWGCDGVEYHGGDVVGRAAHLVIERKDSSFKMPRLPPSLQAGHAYNNTVR